MIKQIQNDVKTKKFKYKNWVEIKGKDFYKGGVAPKTKNII